MVNNILRAAGIPYRRTRFPSPPAGTYAVYMDEREADGADGINCLIRHHYIIEVYESKPDDQVEARIEEALDSRGIPWTCQDRYWLPEEQRYQVIYEFDYIEKRRINNG